MDPFPEESARLARIAVGEARNGRGTLAGAMLPLTRAEDAEPGTQACVDATGCYWESPVDALYGGVLGLCGCGFSVHIRMDLRALLLSRETPGVGLRPLPELSDPSPLYREVLLHLLTDAGLLEHGSTVVGSWLTELGLRWKLALS